MSNPSVFCLASCRRQAQEIVSQLKVAGFFSHEISVLFPNDGALAEPQADKTPRPQKQASSGAPPATVGWLAGTGTVKLPGIALLIGSGPILQEFESAATGAAANDLLVGLRALGVPELRARHYDRKIRGGKILIATHAGTSTEIAVAREIFTQSKASAMAVSTPKAKAPGDLVPKAA